MFFAFCRPKNKYVEDAKFNHLLVYTAWDLSSFSFRASEYLHGWQWEYEFQGDNSLAGYGNQRTSGLFSHKSLWKHQVTVADICIILATCEAEISWIIVWGLLGKIVLKTMFPKCPEQINWTCDSSSKALGVAHMSCFHSLAIVSSAEMNIGVKMSPLDTDLLSFG
jgi:hypothetical protein